MKTIKKCCYNCQYINKTINCFGEEDFYCEVKPKLDHIENPKNEKCDVFLVNKNTNEYLLEGRNTKNVELNIIIDGVSVASADLDDVEWCKDCDEKQAECKEGITPHCLKNLKKYLLEEAVKDAERELK